MTTSELPTIPSATPVRRTPSRRPRLRRAGALVAAGGLLASCVTVATSAAAEPSAAASLTAVTEVHLAAYGFGNGGGGRRYGSGAGGGQTATVDSDPATTAEGNGVALIDTVLSGGEAAGTGIVLTSDGEILTNYHVVEGSTSIRVTIASSGTAYTATVVGADPTADVALLQLKDASGLAVAMIDDDTLQVGDDVTAVGNAGGTGTLTAADGDVTSLSSSITTASEASAQGESLPGLIETSADVVAGDSGGPLLDDEGEVVGIDTAASTGAEINGYAVPIEAALTVVQQILSGTETSAVRIGPAAFLGVQLSLGTASSDYLGGPAQAGAGSGALLGGVVDGGAADTAGLAAGDTITRLGATTISTAGDLTAALAGRAPGDRVKVTWTDAAGQTRSAIVTLGSSPVN